MKNLIAPREPNKYFETFEKEGEEKVRENVTLGHYRQGPKTASAKLWLKMKEEERAAEKEAEELSLAREANEIAKKANQIAQTANTQAYVANRTARWALLVAAIAALAALAALLK